MYRSTSVLGVLVLCSSFALLACGDDGGNANPDATIVFVDAPIPDAPTPDAFVCTMTDCGNNQCVNTDTDPLHCGECDMACPEGQGCSSGDCVCPTVNIPAAPMTLAPIPVQAQMGVNIGLIALGGSVGFDAIAIIWDPLTQTTGEDIALPATGLTPTVGYGFNIDINTMAIQTPYLATGGTINFTTACSVGATGTITDATFGQVMSLLQLPPVPVANGCTIDASTFTFTVGDPCPVDTNDAGVTLDAGLDAAP